MNTIDWTHAKLFSHGMLPSKVDITAINDHFCKELAAGTLPFIDYSYLSELEKSLATVISQLPKVKHMILLGVGGSALGAKALKQAFCPQHDWPLYDGRYLWIADNIDVLALEAWMGNLKPEETLVVAVSKSGGTIETLAHYFLLKDWLANSLGAKWAQHMVVITDPSSGFLRQEADQKNLLSLSVPPAMGGRYSVLSAVGLLPAAHLGINWQALAQGAKEALVTLVQTPTSLESHPSFRLALWAYELMQQHFTQLIFFSYIPAWNGLGQWFSQLWAESLGKLGKGSMPIPAVGVSDQHSLQQMFLDGPKDKGCVFLTAKNLAKGPTFAKNTPDKWSWLVGKQFGDLLDAEALGTRISMTINDIPLVHLSMEKGDEYHCGNLMATCMATTLFTGWIMGINPLDQPAVELGKRLANSCLGAPGYDKEKSDLDSFLLSTSKNMLQEF